ncbi:hypothetical protein GCM10009691_16120 [Brevibacterium picturae]|uniref:Uncharacterized protein n=1 Tax=Brevibacterium picturae TaxID=260553 RepID=A0ABN2BMI0_9MICO
MQQAGEMPLREHPQGVAKRAGTLICQRHARSATGEDPCRIRAGDAVPEENDDGHTVNTSPDRLQWAYETSASDDDL